MELHAGPIAMLFEPETTFLRYVRLGDREIVRAIYGAVRDRNWDTVTPQVSDVHLDSHDGGFQLTFDALCQEGDVDFRWAGTITGDTQGTITYTFDGTAHSTFLRNRIGLCLLHPIRECAGEPCTVEHTDSSVEPSAFPRSISPHQPIMDIQAITHTVVPGVTAEVRFEGDVFEMEDQRNWTDASYKTYSTPLSQPFPVEVPTGTRIRQSVTIRLTGEVLPEFEKPPAADPAAAGEHVVRVDGGEIPLPRLGLGIASDGRPLGDTARDLLRALRLSHLRVDLRLAASGYRDVLERATVDARAIGASLEAAIFLSDAAEAELASFVDVARTIQPPVAHWLIFHEQEKSTSERWVLLARRYLSRYDPAIPLGSGTDVYFTELNRGRPTPGALEALDLVCYSINPQVHAFDGASLVESLEGQAATVESGRQIAGVKPLAITPVTLRPRFNPNATGSDPAPAPGELPYQVDPRQSTPFCAAWTVGSLKQLSQDGVASVTYFETTGNRGLMADAPGDPAGALAVFPVYHVFAAVGDFAGGMVVPTTSSNPLAVEALALQDGPRHRVLLANLTAHPQQVRLEDERFGGTGQVRSLNLLGERDEAVQPLAPHGGAVSLTLPPHAIARVDGKK
jgi:D-apionolactonase